MLPDDVYDAYEQRQKNFWNSDSTDKLTEYTTFIDRVPRA
jgi:DNA-binding ferritin-like protein (Dps family)